MQGYLPQSNGRRVTHGWCEIVKNGAITVYDPNFTYNTGRQAFGITYGLGNKEEVEGKRSVG